MYVITMFEYKSSRWTHTHNILMYLYVQNISARMLFYFYMYIKIDRWILRLYFFCFVKDECKSRASSLKMVPFQQLLLDSVARLSKQCQRPISHVGPPLCRFTMPYHQRWERIIMMGITGHWIVSSCDLSL